VFQQSLAIDPEFAEVYMNIGNLYSDEKQYAEAAI
jgi:lipoprotein NlpI